MCDMDLAIIVKGFHYFYDNILPKALFSPDISEDGIRKSFLWATFCEKVYEKLDKESIKNLNKYFLIKSKKFLINDNLQQCSHILCHALLQNPNINRSSLELFISTAKSNISLNEVLDEAVKLKSLGVNLIESLKPLKVRESDRSLYYEIKSELFLEFLKDLSEQLVTEGQFEVHFNLLFDTLCDNEDTMIVLIHAFLRDDVPPDIYTFAIHWILLRVVEERSYSLAHFLWRLSPSKLRSIAVNHPAFFSYYLDSLTKFTESMQLMLENGQQIWKTYDSFYKRLEPTLTYEEVVNHFDVLTMINDNVAEESLAHLRKMNSREPRKIIWGDIINAVT